MRRVVYADSFAEDADEIAIYIEARFGTDRADQFTDQLNHFCEVIAHQPGRGKTNHGFDTQLYGVVFGLNWIFFQFDDDQVRFVHVVGTRKHKPNVRF